MAWHCKVGIFMMCLWCTSVGSKGKWVNIFREQTLTKYGVGVGAQRRHRSHFFNLASGAQGWQREDAEQEAGEGFPAPRLVPFLGRRCGRRGESVWHSKGPLRLMLVRIPSKHVLTGSSDGRYPSRGWGAMHDALRREIPA